METRINNDANHGRRRLRKHHYASSQSAVSESSSRCSVTSCSSSISNSSKNKPKTQQNRRHYEILKELKTDPVGMSCKMVGTRSGKSVVARVVVVDKNGKTILDEYIMPEETVTSYRTIVSGITRKDLETYGKPLSTVRHMVGLILAGKILVGHGLREELESLDISHPWYLQRDAADYEPFMQEGSETDPTGCTRTVLVPRKLLFLTIERLGRPIHQAPDKPPRPAEDAIAALELYYSQKRQWEKSLKRQLERIVLRYKREQEEIRF